LSASGLLATAGQAQTKPQSDSFADVERILRPLCDALPSAREGEWLHDHPEPGQSFDEYVASDPVRKSNRLSTIYLSVLGDADESESKIFERTREYLQIFFGTSVKFADRWNLMDVPDSARRISDITGKEQILTTHVLEEMLTPARPKDALAYLALTTSDLWPGEGWNFVFGQASLRQRVGVWSIDRFGETSDSEGLTLALRRTIGTAAHETMHILSMPHCIEFLCCLNGSNHLKEADSKPLHTCAVCERKLSWNLNQGPLERFEKLEAFCRENEMAEEADWFQKAIQVLRKS
jgi:archaemetzincin